MKKSPMLLALLLATGAALALPQSAPPQPSSAAVDNSDSVNAERFKMALTDQRRKLFAAAMGNLTAPQLETFWSVYSGYEEEKNAITSARLDLAHEYVDTFTSGKGLDDATITKIVNEMGSLQKKNIDLRLKYFDIYSQKRRAGLSWWMTTSPRPGASISSRPYPFQGTR